MTSPSKIPYAESGNATRKGLLPSEIYSQPGRPSVALEALRWGIRLRLLSRGYSWLLAYLPHQIWGGESLRVDTNTGPMVLPVWERSSSSLICTGRDNEWREAKLIAAVVATCHTMFDIGAHYGWYCRVMGRASPSGQVFAFEPDAKVFPYLKANIEDLPAVHAYNVALSDKPADGTLWCSSSRDLNSIVRKVGRPQPVSFSTIDEFCSNNRIGQVDFVKCDVEGAEVLILRGAQELLRGSLPPIWMLEVSEQFWKEAGFTPQEFLDALQPNGTPAIRFFTQDGNARPVEIHTLGERIIGNNVFVVPEARLEQWNTAVGRLSEGA